MAEVKRFYALDATRGIAALAVVFWHWQHVYLIGGGKLEDRTSQPFFDFLYPLYQNGWLAVEFFFTLSGFVFFWLYSQKIADKSLGFGAFAMARFSRLYPLHFVVLIAVAVMQMALMSNGYKSFIYTDTNVKNFILNLLFLQHFSGGPWTFNGPEWSVGVEVLLYAAFFAYCRMFRPRWQLPLILSVIFGAYVMGSDWTMGRGIIGFFAGGLVYTSWAGVQVRPKLDKFIMPFVAVIAAAWVFTLVEARIHPLATWLDGFGVRGWWWVEASFRFALVPLTVLALALQEQRGAKYWKKLAPLGDLTYGLYLLHFPIQLAIAVAVLLFGMPLAPVQTPLGLIVYLTVLIGLSIASYHWIERPAQSWLRSKLPRRSVVEKPA